MQHLEVSCAVRPLKWSLGVKWLRMLWMLPIADKTNGITIILYYCYYYHLHCT